MSDALGLTAFREQMAALLRTEMPDDIGVFDIIPDSISPPAIYIAWSNPWLVPATFCSYNATTQLICVAARIEPGGQYTILEDMVGQIFVLMHSKSISIRDASSPYPITLGGVNYLAATVNLVTEMGV